MPLSIFTLGQKIPPRATIDPAGVSNYDIPVDLNEIQKAAAKLSELQQRQLAAFLTKLRLERVSSIIEELSRRLDDKDPANWISLADAKESLGDT